MTSEGFLEGAVGLGAEEGEYQVGGGWGAAPVVLQGPL